MAAIALRHLFYVTSGKVFVLGGKVVKTESGVATVDLDSPDAALVALSLFHMGYRVDEDGNEIASPGDLDARIAALTGDTDGTDDEDDDEDPGTAPADVPQGVLGGDDAGEDDPEE